MLMIGEIVRALKLLQRMQAVAPKSPALHLQAIEIALLVQNPPANTPESVLQLVRQELEVFLPLSSITLENFNTQYLQQKAGDLEAAIAAAKAQWSITGKSDKNGVLNIVLESLKNAEKPKLAVSLVFSGCTFTLVCPMLTPDALLQQHLQSWLDYIKAEVQADAQQVEAFSSAAQGFYPNASVFKSADALAAQRAAIDESREKEKQAGDVAAQ